MKFLKEDRKLFYALLFPALIEALFSRIFHITDSIMLGHMVDSTPSVAAVGICGAPTNLIISTTTAFFIGTTATVSWYFGAKDKKAVKEVAEQSMTIAFIVATLITALSVCFAEPLMKFICGESEFLHIAVNYYRITAYGFFFQILTANITAMLRGVGVSKLPMLYNTAAGAINVLLNYLLIYGMWGLPELRADGAALATTISKFIAFVIAVSIIVSKNTDVKYRPKKITKFCQGIKSRFFPTALTAAGEQIILQIGAVLTSKIIAVLPTADIAANQIVVNLESFAWSTGAACQAASTPLFARFLGANNEPKAKASLSYTLKWAIGFAVGEILLFSVFGKQIAALFTNDTSIYGIIYILLLIGSISLPFINIHRTVSGALRSAGDAIAPLIASFISLWVFRVLLGYLTISVFDMGMYAYRVCISIDQFVRCAIVCTFYLTGHWKKRLFEKR